MSQCGIAVLGAGMIGSAHAQGYRLWSPCFAAQIPGLSLAVVCDGNEDLASRVAQRYGFARVSRDWKSVLDDPGIGIVSVALPNFLHAEVVVAALDAGEHGA
jgi:predicted dehydrogenase